MIRIHMIMLACAAGALFPAAAEEDEPAGLLLTLTQAEKPADTPAWEQPAYAALTINDDAGDSFAVHVNAKAQTRGRDGLSFFSRLAFDRDNQIKDPQNNLKAGAGARHERAFCGERIPPIEGVGEADDVDCLPGMVLTSTFELGFNRQVQYNDVAANPALPAEEDVESIRATFDAAPWLPAFEGERGGVAYALGAAGGLYYDNVLNNVIDEETGLPDTGDVFGGRLLANLTLAPAGNEAWRLTLAAQGRQPFSATGVRDVGAEGLFKASLDFYVANAPSLVRESDEEDPKFRPAIGIEFTTGEDSLSGLTHQTTLVLAFKLGRF